MRSRWDHLTPPSSGETVDSATRAATVRAAQVDFVDGVLIGAVGVITNKPFGWALNTSASIADPSLPLREVWADLLTGKRSELAGTMLALGVIPSDYDLGDLRIDAANFVFATEQLDDDDMSESYVRILEAQVEELCAPLAVTGLNSAEAGAIADQIWFETDVLAACLKSAIDRLDRLTTISEALELARYNLERAF